MSSEDEFDFEASLKELEALVGRLEQGELTLEQSLRSFERGVELTRACQKALDEAEQKVELLVRENGEERREPFVPDDADDD